MRLKLDNRCCEIRDKKPVDLEEITRARAWRTQWGPRTSTVRV